MSSRFLVTASRAGLGLCLGALACEDDEAILQGSLASEDEASYECARLPSACPSAVPSYAGEVAGIVERHCGNCHREDNPSGPWPFSHRQDIADWALSIRSTLEECLMPPPETDTPLSAADREKLQSWLACGAPDN